jgi:hypothetical protein
MGEEGPPFHVGDRVEYLGPISTEAPGDQGQPPDVLLRKGMVGEIVQASPARGHQAMGQGDQAYCRVRFENGYERTILWKNAERFRKI